jgi:hypothetical protein
LIICSPSSNVFQLSFQLVYHDVSVEGGGC